MKILVTGGAGFIGSHVVDALIERGDTVIVLDHRAPSPLHRRAEATYVIASLNDEEALAGAVAGAGAVCHQAAKVGLGVDFDDVTAYVHDNAAGTAALLRSLWRRQFTGRIVVASSMVVYGEGAYRCKEHGSLRPAPRRIEDLDAGRFEPRCPTCDSTLERSAVDECAPLDPRNVYAATKVHTEHLATEFGRASGASVIALRYHNVYGSRMPRDTPYSGVAAIFRSALAAGRAPQVFEDGGQVRDFIHVSDVARANLAALDSSFVGALNVASGQPHTILDMASMLAVSTAGPAPVVTGRWRAGDVRHVVASPERAASEIGFRAAVRFEEGMARFAREP